MQHISNDLVDKRKTHKDICPISTKCYHEMACIKECYYTNGSYIENDTNNTEDDDDESEDDESENDKTEDSDSDINVPIVVNKCGH